MDDMIDQVLAVHVILDYYGTHKHPEVKNLRQSKELFPSGESPEPAVSIRASTLDQPHSLTRTPLEPETDTRISVGVCVIGCSNHRDIVYIARNHIADGCRLDDIAIRNSKFRTFLLA